MYKKVIYFICTIFCSLSAMDSRRPSLPLLPLVAVEQSLQPSTSPHKSPSISSPRTLENEQFLKLLKKFIKERQAKLTQSIESKTKAKESLILYIQNPEMALPALDPEGPYLIEEHSVSTSSTDAVEDLVRKIVPNKAFEDKYYTLLGISKSQRINSGNYGNSQHMGLFEDFKDAICEKNKTINPDQENFLCVLFRTFRDNYRSCTAKEVREGALKLELGKVSRGFEAVSLLFKDKERVKRLLFKNSSDENSKSETHATTSLIRKFSHLTLRTPKKTVHTRQRSNSDVH